MSFRIKFPVALAATIFLLSSGTAQAVSIYGTPADLTGTRTTATVGPDIAVAVGGLAGEEEWSTDFGVSWEITDNLNGTFTYEYTFLGFGDKDKEISHVVIDLSDDCISGDMLSDPSCVTDADFNGAPIAGGFIEFGDKDGITGGVKFDLGSGDPAVYTFISNRLPVWGHLAVKDGGGPGTCAGFPTGTAIICNNALLGIGADDDPINYIARPNGVIPLPPAVWLFGSALGLLGWIRRRAA